MGVGIKEARSVGCALCFLCTDQIIHYGDPRERVFCILIGSQISTCSTASGVYITGKIAIAYRFHTTQGKT
jgi:hypothetical protein